LAFSHGSFIFHPRRRPAQRRALPGASFGLATLDGRRRRRGSVVGAGTIVPGSWRSLVMFRRRRMLRSSADAPFSRLIRTLPLCALQVHEVLAGKFSISPYCRQNQRNLHLLWLHHHVVGERRCFRSQRPEVTCCCQFTAMTA